MRACALMKRFFSALVCLHPHAPPPLTRTLRRGRRALRANRSFVSKGNRRARPRPCTRSSRRAQGARRSGPLQLAVVLGPRRRRRPRRPRPSRHRRSRRSVSLPFCEWSSGVEGTYARVRVRQGLARRQEYNRQVGNLFRQHLLGTLCPGLSAPFCLHSQHSVGWGASKNALPLSKLMRRTVRRTGIAMNEKKSSSRGSLNCHRRKWLCRRQSSRCPRGYSSSPLHCGTFLSFHLQVLQRCRHLHHRHVVDRLPELHGGRVDALPLRAHLLHLHGRGSGLHLRVARHVVRRMPGEHSTRGRQ